MRYILLVLIVINSWYIPIPGQVKEPGPNTIEVRKDTLHIRKQARFNMADSRRVMQFELPQNTLRCLYYFESIDKIHIKDALDRTYFYPNDFKANSSREDLFNGYGFRNAIKMGPVKLEVLLLDDKGAEEFLQVKNGYYTTTRPEHYFKNGSSLCEVGDCNSSGKVIVDPTAGGKLFLGFRNIDYRVDAYIIVQIVAVVK